MLLPMKRVVIGLLGCGTVGSGVVKLLTEHEREVRERLGVPVFVKRIAVRDQDKKREIDVDRKLLTGDLAQVVDDPEIQVVVELIGGLEPTRGMLLRAIKSGKHVVTANKALLAAHGQELFDAARAAGVTIAFEGSVGGGIPVIRCIREGLVANRIKSIFGIINGTTNYILSEMTDTKASYADALAGAQARGYAEADPTLDVNGGDAAHKLAVLAACAWGVPVLPDAIPTRGIDTLDTVDIENARQLGYTVKLLGIARQSAAGLALSVHPTLVPHRHVLASVPGAFNAIYIEGDPVGPLLLYGRGAGSGPTASAVVADLMEVGRDLVSGGVGRVPLPFGPGDEQRPPLAHPDQFRSAFYLRFSAYDKPGVLARIAGALGAQGVSISAVVQKDRRAGEAVPILVLTHETERRALYAAVADIDRAGDVVAGPTVVLHAENLAS